jgi:hypothetical protein
LESPANVDEQRVGCFDPDVLESGAVRHDSVVGVDDQGALNFADLLVEGRFWLPLPFPVPQESQQPSESQEARALYCRVENSRDRQVFKQRR